MPWPLLFFLLSLLGHSLWVMQPRFAAKSWPKACPGQRGVEAASHCEDAYPWQQWLMGQKGNLNQVGRTDLMLIPGVGRSLANSILRHRRALGAFHGWHEVKAIPGVGPQKLKQLQDLFQL